MYTNLLQWPDVACQHRPDEQRNYLWASALVLRLHSNTSIYVVVLSRPCNRLLNALRLHSGVYLIYTYTSWKYLDRSKHPHLAAYDAISVSKQLERRTKLRWIAPALS
jgi:hypothetical protein